MGREFSEGLAAVRHNNKWGYIDKTGKLVIDCQFDRVDYFSGELARVEIAGKSGVIDKAGVMQFPCLFDSITWISKDLISIYMGELEKMREGYIDRAGNHYWED